MTRSSSAAVVVAHRVVLIVALGAALRPAASADLGRSPALLEHLRAVQESNQALFRAGSATVALHGKTGTEIIDVVGTISWDGPHTQWQYRQDKRVETQPATLDTADMFYQIDTEHFTAFSEGRSVQIWRDIDQAIPRELQLRPDQCWFHIDGWSRPWSEMLDPQRFKEPKFRYSAREEANNVIVSRSRDDGSMTITFSRDHGLNVTSYDYRSTGVRSQGSYVWRQSSAGWYPTQISFDRVLKGARVTYTIHISDFKPADRIPMSQFAIESLPSTDGGSYIEFTAAGQKRRRIQKTPEQLSDLLKKVGEAIKHAGFAAPK